LILWAAAASIMPIRVWLSSIAETLKLIMFSEQERFQQLMEKVTNFAIIFKNAEGIIEEWNIGAERLFGYSREEAVGQSIEIIYTPEDRAENVPAREMRTAAQRNGENVAEDERWHIRKDGTLFYASGLLHALYQEGVLTCYVKIIRDLTERVEMEAALEDSQKLLEIKVEQHTSELGEANKVLKMEMAAQKRNDILRLRFMQRIIEKQEDERKRISRDIHDHLGQEMTALSLQLQLLKEQFGKDAELTGQIEKAQEMAQGIDSTIDFLAWELRPAALEEIGLEAAIRNFIREWSRQFKIPADVHSRVAAQKRLIPVTEVNLYRIAQEALNNIAKHAQAKNVGVFLEQVDHRFVLIIEDDGIGFNVEETANKAHGLGLIGMGERAALLNGEIEIESSIGNGTTLYVRVPAVFEEPENYRQ
jgi:PAS domain S-box-containing protein